MSTCSQHRTIARGPATRHSGSAIAVLFSILALAVSPASAAGPDFSVGLSADTYYTSNLFHVSEKQEDQFDTKHDPGERFHNMEGPGDFVTRTGLDLGWVWDVGEKRDLELGFGADYYLHMRNSVANYARLRADATYDLTRDDELRLGLKFIPERFRKNLSLEDPSTHEKIFERADYREFSVTPGYMHDWNRSWSTGVEYEYCTRDYDDPFTSRDRRTHGVTGLVEYGGFKRMDVALGVGFSTTATPTDTEFGIEVDRSFQDFIVDLGLGFDLPRRWEAKLDTKLRRREYTTDVSADTTHYNRTDTLWSIDMQIGKHFRKNLFLAMEAAWNYNNSDRAGDATIESDEVGYREYVIGLTAEWRF